MAILTREEILKQAGQRETKVVEVPELGGSVIIRALSGKERDKFEGESVTGKGKNTEYNYRNIRARLVAATAVDEHGNKLFTPEDVSKLGDISAGALSRLFDVARELSGMTEKDVAELAENLGNARNDDGTSD